ncbi:MAG: DsbA family protein [Methyloceanibacter sp.]|uniref:DsbA family protein n=1 Tax=Methyloceanibacter sp. TaxID=1965321 RepID=UPI003D6D7CE5
MTPKTGLATALVAAVVAAIVSAATILVIWRTAPGVVDAPSASLQENEVVDIVRNYLTENPEILVEMTTELDKRQQQEQAALQEKVISDSADALFRSPLAFAAGNPNGDVTVVEFFDYNCGYCKRAMPDVVKLIDNDGQVRFVFKELPIFGEESEDAAKGALAANKQGKYFEMHQKLFTAPGKANKDKVLRVANEIGLDVPQLEKDMESEEVQQALDEARELAQKLGLQGTPLYLIGDRTIPGAPEDLYDQLVENVAEVRKNGCKATC